MSLYPIDAGGVGNGGCVEIGKCDNKIVAEAQVRNSKGKRGKGDDVTDRNQDTGKRD
jgi:hypothetical protein